MKNIILILLVIVIFVFINKPLETMSVNLNCKKYKSKVDSQLNMNHAIRKGDSRKISHDIAQSNVI